MRTTALALSCWLLAAPAAASQTADAQVATASQLAFHSDFLMNLHHTLFAAAWARRPEAGTLRALAGALPAPLTAPMTEAEQAAWDAAVTYYDREVASRDLLRGRGMYALKTALVAGDLSSPAVGHELRAVLDSAAPVYRKHFWPAHDRANHEWIAKTVEGIRTIGPEVIAKLTALYTMPWFTAPVRVDVVWVGNRQGAYATEGPTHATIASQAPNHTGWTSVEIVFHEISHTLIAPIEKQLASALGDRLREHGVLWHVVQFYLTGEAVRGVLAARGIQYEPYLYSSGLVDRAWPAYRRPVEEHWRPYVDGRTTLEAAVRGTAAAVTRQAPVQSPPLTRR